MITNFYTEVPRKSYSPIRYVECLLCLICGITAIYILNNFSRLHPRICSVLLVVSVPFFFITLIDLYARCLLKSMLWTTWILFATLAALTFTLCGGFLIFQLHAIKSPLYLWTMMINFITALVFLLEVICIIFWLIQIKADLRPSDDEETKTSIVRIYKKPTKRSSKVYNSSSEEGIIRPLQKPFRQECPCCQKYNSGESKSPCKRERDGVDPEYRKVVRKRSSSNPLSHGGTFHVSKDVAPILSSRTPPPSPKESVTLQSCSRRATVLKSQTKKEDNRNSPPFYKSEIYEENETVIGTAFIPTSTKKPQTLATVKEDDVECSGRRSNNYDCRGTPRHSVYQQSYCTKPPKLSCDNPSNCPNKHPFEDTRCSRLNPTYNSDRPKTECNLNNTSTRELSKYILVKLERKALEQYLEEETVLPGTTDSENRR